MLSVAAIRDAGAGARVSSCLAVLTSSLLACGTDDANGGEPDGSAVDSRPEDGGRADGPSREELCRRLGRCGDPPPPDPCDEDGDGADGPQCGGDDCDDGDEGRFPGATEYQCDNVDQDCDGRDTCQPDADGDGWRGCEREATGGCDCDDTDPNINPGVPDIPCDGIDNSCLGSDGCPRPDEDGDGSGACAEGAPSTCDCDDTDPTIVFYANDIPCDGIDQNCDGADCCDNDEDMDGYACREDCDDTNQGAYPGACAPPRSFSTYFDANCDGRIDIETDMCPL